MREPHSRAGTPRSQHDPSCSVYPPSFSRLSSSLLASLVPAHIPDQERGGKVGFFAEDEEDEEDDEDEDCAGFAFLAFVLLLSLLFCPSFSLSLSLIILFPQHVPDREGEEDLASSGKMKRRMRMKKRRMKISLLSLSWPSLKGKEK